MDVTQTFTPSSPQSDSPNGHGHPDGDGDLNHYAKRDNDRETTRYLSAAAQMDLAYARWVVGRVVYEPYRALAPSGGADVVTVARWALDSLRRHTERNVRLAGILCAGVLLSWLVWVIVPQHVWITAAIASTLFAAFAVVAREYWVRWHEVLARKMLRGSFRPDLAPEPTHAWTKQRLAEIAEAQDGNAVVFYDKDAFVGSGNLLASEQVVIDVSCGKTGDDGVVREPLPFTSGDLHEACKKTIRELALEDLSVGERVFVNGRHVQANKQLQRRRLERPLSVVSADLLTRTAEHPAPDARTYVCAEVRRWQGQLSVALFVRAAHVEKWLYLEWSLYVLPPLSDAYKAIDRLYVAGMLRAARESAGWGLRWAIPSLLASPFTVLGDLWRGVEGRASRARQAYQIAHGRVFNYGARPSIREVAAARQPNPHYFLGRDATMYVLLLQNSLVRGISTFLDERNIALTEFEAQVKIIINAANEYYNVHIGGDVSGSNISIGRDASSGSGPKPPPTKGDSRG